MDFKILYEDKYLLAIFKKPGILSQSDSEDDILSALKYKAHIINRLDRPVGGIVLIAKEKEAAAKMTELLQQGGISKHYYAVVQGSLSQGEEQELTDYLAINRRLNLSKIVNKGMPNAKEAKLAYKVIAQHSDSSLLDITLFTGRHHQIRAQLAYHKMPIWGDTKYNDSFKHKRGVLPALFACKIAFTHPYSKEYTEIQALPDYGKFIDYSEAFQ